MDCPVCKTMVPKLPPAKPIPRCPPGVVVTVYAPWLNTSQDDGMGRAYPGDFFWSYDAAEVAGRGLGVFGKDAAVKTLTGVIDVDGNVWVGEPKPVYVAVSDEIKKKLEDKLAANFSPAELAILGVKVK